MGPHFLGLYPWGCLLGHSAGRCVQVVLRVWLYRGIRVLAGETEVWGGVQDTKEGGAMERQPQKAQTFGCLWWRVAAGSERFWGSHTAEGMLTVRSTQNGLLQPHGVPTPSSEILP